MNNYAGVIVRKCGIAHLTVATLYMCGVSEK